MSAAIGWYGPLIDLSRASSHVGDLVQLLVFVRRAQPIQKVGASSRRSIFKTNIEVGDDTKPYFVVSVWHKYISSMIAPGDVILLQNVKILTFREVLEAATLQVSFLTVLAHCNNLTAEDSDQLIAHLQLGRLTREKFNKVLYWIQHTKSAINHVQQTDFEQNKVQVPKNWKSPEDQKPKECLSIKGVLCLRDSCKTFFHAFIGEILFPYPWRCEKDKEQLYLRKTLLEMAKIKITDDIICVGCMTCGSPMDSRFPSNKSNFPLYCGNSSNYVHDIGQIYRPFLLHVWDHSGVVTLLVKNRAATILFGNLTARKVYKCYKQESVNQNPALVHNQEFHSSNLMGFAGDNDSKSGSDANTGNSCRNKPNFYEIWLILIKVLPQQQEHPFLIEVAFDKEKDIENGRFELTSLRMPCHLSERPQGILLL